MRERIDRMGGYLVNTPQEKMTNLNFKIIFLFSEEVVVIFDQTN